MGLTDFLLTWRSNAATATLPLVTDEDVPADVDEPPENPMHHKHDSAAFTKSLIPSKCYKQSLLTKAIQNGAESESYKPEVHVTTDLSRRRSMMSNASIASTAELTSDGGLTSPARTNTPSPPIPQAAYPSLSPYPAVQKTSALDNSTTMKLGTKGYHTLSDVTEDASGLEVPVTTAPRKRCITFMCDGKKETLKPEAPVEAVPRKRCITFMCDGKRESSKPLVKASVAATDVSVSTEIAAPQPQQPRKCTIKFACPGPKLSEKASMDKVSTPPKAKPVEAAKRSSRSPSLVRKSQRPSSTSRPLREATSATRRASQSPVAVRVKPKYIIADEKMIKSSEATRFHEFASEEIEEDDWIRKDAETPRAKLTIDDTLEKENAIRRLGSEAAEEEALEEEDEDEEEDDLDENFSDDETGFEVGGYEDEDEDEDFEKSEDDASDGNETDNEAGFAESDDESDAGGDFAFWTPGKQLRDSAGASTYRPSAHRAASVSSIDSLDHMQLSKKVGVKQSRRRPIKIRPGTPDLPDSTDFVCGTLDEDRPLEDAYVSCMEARKNAKHKLTPQDIDPSFPTSDLEGEDEEDENDAVDAAHDSDEQLWLHGKFEESDDERYGRRRSATTLRKKSPQHSPKRLRSPPPPRRLHSPPPPAKQRHRSPPPRKLFGNSPNTLRSPSSTGMTRSPAASPTSNSYAVNFTPLGSRPGLTHTKSLPRAPNAFCRAYHASRLEAANNNEWDNSSDGHVRAAIDIVKGLEAKRQRRKDKFAQKHCKKNKGHTERRPQPGRGAERMRELGLLMAGKPVGVNNDPYMMSA